MERGKVGGWLKDDGLETDESPSSLFFSQPCKGLRGVD